MVVFFLKMPQRQKFSWQEGQSVKCLKLNAHTKTYCLCFVNGRHQVRSGSISLHRPQNDPPCVPKPWSWPRWDGYGVNTVTPIVDWRISCIAIWFTWLKQRKICSFGLNGEKTTVFKDDIISQYCWVWRPYSSISTQNLFFAAILP